MDKKETATLMLLTLAVAAWLSVVACLPFYIMHLKDVIK